MISMEWIISRLKEDNYFFSQHADDERLEDNLMVFEIEDAILNGSILENYPDDKRGNSCLVVGFTKDKKPLHIVCGKSGDRLVIITVYIPTKPKFISPYKRSSNENL